MENGPQNNQPEKQSQKHNLFKMLQPQIPSIHPVDVPTIHSDVLQETFLIRTTISLMYFIRLLEHKLSPSGRLRAWFKLNILLMLWIAIPCLFIIPFISTSLMALGDMSESLEVISYNVLSACLPILLIAGLVILFYRLLMK